MYYDYKLRSGTKLERAVSPECNENVASKRNLKNECKKLHRQPLKRLQLCRRRLDKVEIIFFTVYLINNRKNNSWKKEALSQEVKL